MLLEDIINKHFHTLTDVELIILDYIVQNQKSSENYSIDDLANLTHTSKSSIVRLSQKLGFDGFSEFKYFLKYNQQAPLKTQTESSTELLLKDIEDTLKYLDNFDFHQLNKKLNNAEKLFAYGTGYGENKAVRDLSRNFLTSHKFITVFPSITEFFWNVDALTENDVIFICSYSGNNDDLQSAINRVKLRGATIISITPLQSSYLTNNANINIYYYESPLNIESSNFKEFNFYVTLNIVIDMIYRKYLDQV